jgi:DNA-binding beta-propeller fold protein YncE
MSGTASTDPIVQDVAARGPSALQYLETLHLNYQLKPSPGPSFKILPCAQDCYLLSDELNHRVLKFDPFGELIWQTGGKGMGPGQFWYPRGIAVFDDEIYVCDSWNHRIQVLNAQGKPIRSFGVYGSESDQFNECSDIEADEQGRLWIVDTGNHCLKVLNPRGKVETVVGRRLSIYEERALIQGANQGSTHGFSPGFSYPNRILANYTSAFCVDDRGNQRICLISTCGSILASMDSKQNQVTRYVNPASRLERMAEYPVARLRMQLLEVIDWNGLLWQSVPASRFSEINSRLVQTSGQTQLLIYYYNWTTQNLIKYALVLPTDPLDSHPNRESIS